MDGGSLSSVVVTNSAEFEATRAERAAIAKPTRTTFDVVSAYVVVGTSLPRIRAYTEQLASIGAFDLTLLDRVLVYGRAAIYALQRERALSPPKSEAHPKLVREMERLHARFFNTAKYLVAMGLMDEGILSAARSGRSVVARALDLGTIAIEFNAERARLGSQLILTVEEVARACAISYSIIESLAARTVAERTPSEFKHDRQRAATVFLEAWDEIRRAVHWVRWHEGDASELAPSLFDTADRRAYKARKGRARKERSDNGEPTDGTTDERAPTDERVSGGDPA